jgi:hypothetical protein
MASVLHYTPKELFEAAQLGLKLKPKQRLLVMVWLEKTGKISETAESQLAQILGCKIGSLRRLRTAARAEVASAISPAEAMNYMAEYVRHQDLVIAESLDCLKTGPKNTGLHQGYMRILMEASSEKVTRLQSIGVIPKELGRLTTVAEEWTAVINDGVVSVGPTPDQNEPA